MMHCGVSATMLEYPPRKARDIRGWPALDQFGNGLRLAIRSLKRAPGYTATAVLALALGIGASTAIFSIVHALLVMPLQYHESSQLVKVQSLHKEEGFSDVAPATFGDLRDTNTSFASLAAQYYYYVNLGGTETPTRLNSADVTADFFRLFDVAPIRGRTWTTDDLKPGAPPVVVLGYPLWRSQFNSSESVVGRQILLDDVAYTVIGVMPASFKDPSEIAQLWRPMRQGADKACSIRSSILDGLWPAEAGCNACEGQQRTGHPWAPDGSCSHTPELPHRLDVFALPTFARS